MVPARVAPQVVLALTISFLACDAAFAQEPASPPAYLAVVEGTATVERDGEIQPAVRDMPFVAGDRLRTDAGRVEIDFPDGTAIDVGPNSEIEALSSTRVRLLAGTMDRVSPQRAPQTASSPYLPTELQRYGPTFDQYGSWDYEPSYGSVWYPRVAAGWQPYYYGWWAPVPSYGWTWIGLDVWSWPTHHYGRWGFVRNRWFWAPGRAWSAAWVSWGYTPEYVSWCPLGFDGRPVFALSVAIGRPFGGWTVLPRAHFGDRGYFVHRYAVDTRRFDARTRFVQTSRLPMNVGAGHAFDRGRSVVQGRDAQFGNRTVASGNRTIASARPSGVGGRPWDSGGRRSTLDARAPQYAPRTVGPRTAEPRGTMPTNRAVDTARAWNRDTRPVTPQFRAPNPAAPRTAPREYRSEAPGYRRAAPAPPPAYREQHQPPQRYERAPSHETRGSAPSQPRERGGSSRGNDGGESHGRRR